MKKLVAILLGLAMVLAMTACSKEVPLEAKEDIPVTESVKTPETIATLPTIVRDAFADDLEAQIEAEIEATVDALSAELEILSVDIDDFHAYLEQIDDVQAFYEKILTTSAELCIRLYNYAALCAENVLVSGKSTDDMYDDMDIIYDLIYEDMGDEFYDGIYDGILDEVYDAFYGGALDDRPDDVEYADWSDVRSDAYEMWADARSDAYEQWADFRSEVYGFWSDMRGALWGDDLEDAVEELEDFREDVEEMANEAIEAANEAIEAANKETVETIAQEPTETIDNSSDSNGIRPEFKEAMDSYEAFFDEYVAFMETYMDSNDPISMMGDYTEMMLQYVETMGELEDIDEEELSEAEALYYAEVMLRINQKLLEIV